MALNGLLYVVGGFDGSGNPLYPDGISTVEVYSPSTNTWRTLGPMPTPRGYPAAGVINGTAYVVGGECCGISTTVMGTNQGYTP